MMTWLLTWLNVSVAKLNATLQLLERVRERERGFCEWKNRNYAWNKRGNGNFIV